MDASRFGEGSEVDAVAEVSGDEESKLTTEGVRNAYFLSANFLALAGALLYFMPAHSEMYFPFYISNATTAGFLGANYLASAALDLLCRRERRWADARIGLPVGFLFATLIGVVTAINIEYFRFEWPVKVATIFWLIIYWGVPVVFIIALVHQSRRPGGDPPRTTPPPQWLRTAFLLLGAGTFIYGVLLFLMPPDLPNWDSTAWTTPKGASGKANADAHAAHKWKAAEDGVPSNSGLWPWSLTSTLVDNPKWAVSVQAYVAAWIVSFGFLFIHAWWENDLIRVRPMLIDAIVVGVLQLGSLARNPPPGLADPAGILFVVALFCTIAIGIVGLRAIPARTSAA